MGGGEGGGEEDAQAHQGTSVEALQAAQRTEAGNAGERQDRGCKVTRHVTRLTMQNNGENRRGGGTGAGQEKRAGKNKSLEQ